MGLKNLHLKLKGIRIRNFLIGSGRRRARKSENGKRDSWMNHVSHGYHVVGLERSWSSVRGFDSVVVQREEIQQCELWFFGVFYDGIGEAVTKYMQSQFFDKMPKESRMEKQCKQAMKMAHLNARTKLGDNGAKSEATLEIGSTTAMVINGEKLVVANMGDYQTVICRSGEAYQICRKQQQTSIRHWSRRLIPGLPKVQKTDGKSSALVVGIERIDSETEFVILASNGVWEVMRHQEAVNLIRHIENPQEAAEYLATEALTRMSKSNISCLIIRFD